jgi:starch synthase
MSARKLKILIVSAEVAPFAKVGGLADVAGALPKSLKALGHDVRVAMPGYKMVTSNAAYDVQTELKSFPVPIREGVTETGWVKRTTLGDGIPVYLVGHKTHFAKATQSSKVYVYDPEPYIFFDRAVCEAIPRIEPEWIPDVIHCNDWHTGLIPVYLDAFYSNHPTWANTKRVFTIHNLAYQGDFDHSALAMAGLPEWMFTYDRLEFYSKVNFLKAGLVYSHDVNTVSVKYSQEIQTPEYGCQLEGLLKFLSGQERLFGILNGIDTEEYDPSTDPRIPAKFSAVKPAGKAKCRTALQAEAGLPKSKDQAVVGLISRFADQKGFDLIEQAAEKLLELPIQLAVLGMGDSRYEAFFRDLEKRYPKQVKVWVGFDIDLAQRIYAGSDLFLMPSRYEPCGLGQLMALRYGSVPIVRSTGGLADTIQEFDVKRGRGNGFVFDEYDSEAMLAAVERAVTVFSNKEAWSKLTDKALASDFSWDRSAKKYVELYRRQQTAQLKKAA